MTNSERERCRQIAQALDRGDVSVCKSEEKFMSEHRGEIWAERQAQKSKLKPTHPRREPERDFANDADDKPERESPEPFENDDDDEAGTGECMCDCGPCLRGDCGHCSDALCRDPNCEHADFDDDFDE